MGKWKRLTWNVPLLQESIGRFAGISTEDDVNNVALSECCLIVIFSFGIEIEFNNSQPHFQSEFNT